MTRFLLFFIVTATGLFTGCTGVNSALGGLAEKALSGSGTVAIQRAGIDPDTALPVLKSTIITGDYASAPEGTYALQYRRKTAPGIFNSAAISHEVTINYIGTADRLADAVGLVRVDLGSSPSDAFDTALDRPDED